MTQLFNKSSERWKRQILRNNMPPAEQKLWARLKERRIENCKFRRQYSIENFVVDFYAPELKLAIEVDGSTHFVEGAAEHDRERQAFLEAKGLVFLRFTNEQVYQEIDEVVNTIAQKIRSCRSHSD